MDIASLRDSPLSDGEVEAAPGVPAVAAADGLLWATPEDNHAMPGVRALGMRPWLGTRLYVSGAHRVCAAAGTLRAAPRRVRLQRYMTGFAAVVQRRS